ncbi:TPA: hypothetical protein ACT77R_002812 [Staphylococcus aureus]
MQQIENNFEFEEENE